MALAFLGEWIEIAVSLLRIRARTLIIVRAHRPPPMTAIRSGDEHLAIANFSVTTVNGQHVNDRARVPLLDQVASDLG